ncbi:SPFH/Band 7/PHB domain protein [Methanothermobacter thermautotrophicus]|jgi:regulator of protease activity HflC (stomatin/prohibitin superfamily)|uniref:SPFH/Band 7/PHB domain protein n=1 Tax=Methanothermobacter thermautotrophicus TaxID=145262 RepID=A0A842YM43_METTF|nr:SPFH domain-containing protein [Methanothermobacter thermautotrophicus]MBE2899680.1 SPFH/Band 7/PHB domain protein [Methanothermobacter thermautotrophicus]MCQ8905219.1 SPFH/Band 7/PHB domain protein [Methanothermobacter sp.]
MILELIIVLVLLVLAFKSLKILRPYEKGVVERLGKYQRTVESGLVVIIPFIEAIKKVDMREQVVDVPPQEVITKDNTVVVVDCVIFYEVVDPFNAVYNVVDFYQAITKLAQTNLRNIIGDLELDQTLTSREMINTQLREVLDEATDKWGTRVVRVEIQRIEPPGDIVEAMSKQMKAERMKRAAILEAEGYKQSEIKRAEGDKQAAILEAEGKAEAIKKVADANKYREIAIAEGQAKAILSVFRAMHEGDPTNDIIALKYLEALEKVADGRATKILLPVEATGILGSIAGISEMLSDPEDKGSSEDKKESQQVEKSEKQ